VAVRAPHWLAPLHRCTLVPRGPTGVLDREPVGGEAGAHGLLKFLFEDKVICERFQRGVGGDFAPGRLAPMERVIEDFGHYLNWRLNGVEPRAAPPPTMSCSPGTRSGSWARQLRHAAP